VRDGSHVSGQAVPEVGGIDRLNRLISVRGRPDRLVVTQRRRADANSSHSVGQGEADHAGRRRPRDHRRDGRPNQMKDVRDAFLLGRAGHGGPRRIEGLAPETTEALR
jgi:hypothetical protein